MRKKMLLLASFGLVLFGAASASVAQLRTPAIPSVYCGLCSSTGDCPTNCACLDGVHCYTSH